MRPLLMRSRLRCGVCWGSANIGHIVSKAVTQRVFTKTVRGLCLLSYMEQSSPSCLTPSTVTGTSVQKSVPLLSRNNVTSCAGTAAGTFSVRFYSFCRACQRRLSFEKTFRFVRQPLLGPSLLRRIKANKGKHHVSTKWRPKPRDRCQVLSQPESPCSHLRFP